MSSPILSLQQVVKAYANVRAVDDLSFDIGEGEIFALLGPNGAGKTSTVRMLIGLTQPDSGRIRYRSATGERPRIAAEELGYLPEERGLYQDISVLRVLVYMGQLQGLSPSDCRQRAMHWLQRLDLADRANDKLGALSKGNQQKVQLISAVLHRPRFAVLDEPFSGLDPVNQERLLGFIRELRDEGVTVLLSAHQMALVERLADRILLMNQGKAVLTGDMEALRQNSGLATSLVVTYQQPLAEDIALPDRFGRVTRQDDYRLSIALGHANDINPLLAELASHGAIAELHSNTPSLHDIYINAVGSSLAQQEAS